LSGTSTLLLSSNLSLSTNANNLLNQASNQSLSLSERFIQGLKLPQLSVPLPSIDTFDYTKSKKNLEKMRGLADCQDRFMKIVLTNIDRRSRPIRKQERVVSDSLKKRRIFLEEENFDILDIL
jgi:hypothetical protein